jgi:hypothetical protein
MQTGTALLRAPRVEAFAVEVARLFATEKLCKN